MRPFVFYPLTAIFTITPEWPGQQQRLPFFIVIAAVVVF